ncbi:hypothetical protein [Bradyrhizobium sp. DASA03120]
MSPDKGTLALAVFLLLAVANAVAFVQFQRSRKRLNRALDELEKLLHP